MKKANYMLLLAPCLFLASCQTTPKVDTIDEAEAQKFIHETYKDITPTAPTYGLVKWKITTDSEDYVKKLVGGYIATDHDITNDDGNKGVEVDSTRLGAYLTELDNVADQYGTPGTDAIIAMNDDIYAKLYASGQNEVDPNKLTYRRVGAGLKITSESTSITTVYTRNHTYNQNGQETRFDVNVNRDGKVYTMSIDFKY